MSRARSSAKSAPNAAVYIRISKDREEQLSTEIQEERCRQYVDNRGWPLHGLYVDKGRSAYRRKTKNGRKTSAPVERPELERLMADVRAGVVTAVVVYRLDRLARSVADFAGLWGQLEDSGCEFVSVSEQFDTSTAIGRAMLQISQVFAELESGIKSERIKDWHAKRAADRNFPVGRPPYGYNADHSIDPDRAEIIRQSAQKVIEGRGIYSICTELTEAGVPTANGAHKWETVTMKRMLIRPTIAALVEIEGAFVEGDWEPILDRDKWTEVRRILNDPSKAKYQHSTAVKYLLSGIIRCGNCDAPMKSTRRHKDGKIRYTCGPRSGHQTCNRLSIDGETVDDWVTKAIVQTLKQSDLPSVGAAPDSTVQLDQLQAELDDLARMYGAGDLTVSEWKQASEGIRQRLGEAEMIAQTEPRSATVDVENFETLPLEDRRAMIGWIFDAITIGASDARGPRNKAMTDRIKLSWRI